MKQKIRLAFSLIFACFLLMLTSCEAEKDFSITSESGKKMSREITFKQFQQEIGQSHFSPSMSFSNSTTSKTMTDFDIDTTIVKSLERNFVVYSMKLEPKFQVTNNKFYNLIVYKDNAQEVVKQIIEFLPNTELTSETQEGIYQFLQNTSKEVIYNSKMMTAAPICVNIVWEDVCDCAGHTRDENCSCTSFHSVAHLEVIPCPSYGSPGPEAPTPNTPNNPIPNDPNGGSSGNSNDIGEVSLDPVLPTISKKPCKDLADLSKPNSGDIKPELDWLKTKLNETKEFGVEFEKKLNYNGDIVYPKTEKESDESNHVELSYGGNVIGAAHSHPANITFAIPSYGDLKWLEILLSNTPPFRQKDVFTMIVCKDKAGTISTYAIKITSFSEFTAKINEIWDSSKYSGKSKEQKLDAINDLQKIECSKTNGQYDQLEKSFLEMYAGFGFDILKATDDNLDNWETLKLDNTQPSGVKSIPCTNN